MMIKMKNVTYSRNGKNILSNVTLSFDNSGLVGIYGHSGSGKTTLLNLILGLVKHSSGEIVVFNKNYQNLTEKDVTNNLRNLFGVVYQKDNLFTYDTVHNNLKVVLKLKGIKNYRFEIKRMLKIIKMDKFEKKHISTLSGGEKRRLSFIMAITKSPSILILDEPEAGLDPKSKEIIEKLILDFSKDHLVIMASHNLEYLKEHSDTLYKVHQGRVHCVKKGNNGNKITINNAYKRPFPFSFFISSAFQRIKLKKWRIFFMNMLVSTSLLTMGYASVLDGSIKATIYDSMRNFLKEDAYILSYNYEYNPLLINLNKEELTSLDVSYQKGVIYENNFATLLKNKNSLYLMNKNNKKLVSNSGLDDFNLFTYDENFDLQDDEVILTIPRDIYLEYQNYQGKVNLILEVENEEWQYKDEQIFSVVYAELGDAFSIRHSNPFFNEFLIEEKMRFKSLDNSWQDVPWRLNKKYYLKCDNFYQMISEIDKKYPDLIFVNSQLNDDYYYPFTYYPNSISDEYLRNICKEYGFTSYLKNTLGIYGVYPSAFMSGFSRSLYISSEKNKLDGFIDEINNVSMNTSVICPNDVGYGEINNSRKDNVVFKLLEDNLKENEIAISSTLYKKINGKNNKIYLSYLKSSSVINGRVNRNFERHEYTINSIIEDDDCAIYQSNFWLMRIFPYHFNLFIDDQIVTSVTLFSQNEIKNVSLEDNLLLKNPLKDFKSQLKTTSQTISSLLETISIILICISGVLIFIITDLFISESQKDMKNIILLGGTKKDLIEYQLVLNGYTLLISLLISSLTLLLSIITLNNSMSTGIVFVLNFIPFLLMIVFSLILLGISFLRIVFLKLISA